MRPARLTAEELAERLRWEPPRVARTVKALRRTILAIAPTAAEAIRFRVLCYFHAHAYFGALGGNICMIEVKDGPRCRETGGPMRAVFLSFIHGAPLPDPRGLLQGSQKNKRFVPIPDAAAAASPGVKALLRASRDQRVWDERAEAKAK